MLQRAITGTIFVAVLVAAIILHPLSLAGLFALVAILGLWEFYGLSQKDQSVPQLAMGLLGGAAVYLFIINIKFNWFDPRLAVLILPLISLIFVVELFRKKERPFANLAYTFLGWAYVVVPFGLFNFLANGTGDKHSWHVALGFFILIWCNDTFAYLTGKFLGKHKLFERISPKKTWEGSIGGMLFSIGGAILMWYFWDFVPLKVWIGMAVIVVIFGGLGDLVESMFKRSINIKDSGNILPGHGGILDRFDAVLIAAPVVFAYYSVLQIIM